MSLPDLSGMLAALHGGDVRHVVIGGLAVVAHRHIRATEDVDLVPDPRRENLDRLANVLVALDARLTLAPMRAIGPEERTALRRGRNISVTTALGDIDVVQRLAGVPAYEALRADAVEVRLFDTPVQICSLEHLIAMKRVRDSHIDRADLEALEEDAL